MSLCHLCHVWRLFLQAFHITANKPLLIFIYTPQYTVLFMPFIGSLSVQCRHCQSTVFDLSVNDWLCANSPCHLHSSLLYFPSFADAPVDSTLLSRETIHLDFPKVFYCLYIRVVLCFSTMFPAMHTVPVSLYSYFSWKCYILLNLIYMLHKHFW